MSSTPELSALTTQLEQMNERARWYAGQIWALPLSYLGASLALIANVAGKNTSIVRGVLFCLAAIGLAVGAQLVWLYEGNHRAVMNLQLVEEKLNLTRTAEHHPWTTNIMIVLTFFMSVVYLGAAIWLADFLGPALSSPAK